MEQSEAEQLAALLPLQQGNITGSQWTNWDIAAGGTANIVGGIATRGLTSLFSGDQGSEGIIAGGEISQDAVTGFVGGGLGHLAGDVIHVPDEPIHNGRGSVGAIRRDNGKFANYNNL